MSLTRMKFRVVDAAHDRAIQQALFAAGYSWFSDRSPTYWSSEDAPGFNRALFTGPDGSITYDSLEWFNDAWTESRPEYLLFRGELVEAGGLNPTFDEQQDVCVNATSRYRVYVGEAAPMPGTDGFTIAVFKASDVPVGTKLYA